MIWRLLLATLLLNYFFINICYAQQSNAPCIKNAKQLNKIEHNKDIGRIIQARKYKVKGRFYQSKSYNQIGKYQEIGLASWYGKQNHGKQTANGEIFNQYKISAAHKTLPLPSIVKVENLTNGKSLIVKVNDRGPFSYKRSIDLSCAAAILLGFKEKGITKVKITYMPTMTKKLVKTKYLTHK